MKREQSGRRIFIFPRTLAVVLNTKLLPYLSQCEAANLFVSFMQASLMPEQKRKNHTKGTRSRIFIASLQKKTFSFYPCKSIPGDRSSWERWWKRGCIVFTGEAGCSHPAVSKVRGRWNCTAWACIRSPSLANQCFSSAGIKAVLLNLFTRVNPPTLIHDSIH